MPNELADAISDSNRSTDSISSEQVKQDTVSNYFVLGDWKMRARLFNVEIEARTIGDAFILNHPIAGIIGAVGGRVLGDATMGSWTDIYNNATDIVLTNVAREIVASWWNNEDPTNPTHHGIGTGTTAYSESETELVTEAGTRVSVTYNVATSKTVSFTALYNNETTADIAEIGLFDASSSGNMFIRWVLPTPLTHSNLSQYRHIFTFEVSDSTPGTALIVDEGLNIVRDWLGNVAATPPTYTEWNDATGLPDAGDTAADWDAGSGNEERNAFSSQNRTSMVTEYTTLLTTAELNAVDITKTGTFNASSNGTLFGQIKYGIIPKTALFQVLEIDRYTILR